MSETELLKQFESLGHGCEFGILQRYAGAEPLGLLRFSSAETEPFLRALRNGFAGVDNPDNIELFEDGTGEWRARIAPYDFAFHTGRQAADIDAEQIRKQESSRLELLKSKLLDDLEQPRRIFVRFAADDEADAREIADAIRAYGPGILLWVTLADDANPGGSVRRLTHNLLRGHIDRFWTVIDGAFELLTGQWLSICRNAYEMVHHDNLVQRLEPVPSAPRRNLLRVPDRVPSGIATSWDARCHVLRTDTVFPDTLADGWRVEEGLRSGAVHRFSLELWLPPDFRGTAAVPVFAGLPAIRYVPANLARRGQWQTVWITARTPDPAIVIVGLSIEGKAGDTVFTRDWRLEEGSSPDAAETPI